MKENLAVIFGGVSSEHDVSIVSALQAITFIDKNYYNIVPIYIAKNGVWYTGKQLLDFQNYSTLKLNKLKIVSLNSGSKILLKKCGFYYKKYLKIDCSLIILHGVNGEDGKVMSMLEMSNIPHTAASPTVSGVCLDKCLFKRLLNGLNVANVESFEVLDYEFKSNPQKVIGLIEDRLNFPLIVKPATLGSSIGISVCNNVEELNNALILGFSLSEKILIEKFLSNIIEVNVAILKNGNELIISELEQPLKQSNSILSFDNKYLNSSGSMEGVSRIIPALIGENLKNEIVNTASYVYKSLNLSGVVRFDFIVENQNVYLNEVNTIPGSLAFYLFKQKNIDYKKLINILIKQAYLNNENLNNKTYVFDSSILKSGSLGIKK